MKRHRIHVWPWLRLPGSLLLRDWLALTIGSRIFAWRDMDESELAHEVEHVRQWARHGWAFPIAYFVAALTARRAGKSWYRDNRFEVEARDAAKRLVRTPRKAPPQPGR